MGLFDGLRSERGYRVQHHDPLRRWLLLLLTAALLVGAGWGLYRAGYVASGQDAVEAQATEIEMRSRIEELEARNARLMQQVAALERSNLIADQGAQDVRSALVAMETRMLELNEELSFYKSILAPADMEPGFHIQSLRLEPGEGPGEYRYKLILHQVRGNDRVAKGTVEIELQGRQGGDARTLSLSEFSAEGARSLSFSFKYF
jgi:cell division protein FtsB